jgi:glycosyltransferase involved in cell wall biosynthesis
LVVLAGADSLKDKRKGMDLLFEAWSGFPKRQADLALFGRNGETKKGEIYLGPIESDAQMADAYRAADLYVHPARMENAPCTIQEALACGTPVMAFKVGGIPEMISSGKTGFFAEKISSDSLSQELRKCLRQPENLLQMRLDCREKAEKDWNPVRLSKMLGEILAGVL